MSTNKEKQFESSDIASIDAGKKVFNLFMAGQTEKNYFEICVELGDENRN